MPRTIKPNQLVTEGNFGNVATFLVLSAVGVGILGINNPHAWQASAGVALILWVLDHLSFRRLFIAWNTRVLDEAELGKAELGALGPTLSAVLNRNGSKIHGKAVPKGQLLLFVEPYPGKGYALKKEGISLIERGSRYARLGNVEFPEEGIEIFCHSSWGWGPWEKFLDELPAGGDDPANEAH